MLVLERCNYSSSSSNNFCFDFNHFYHLKHMLYVDYVLYGVGNLTTPCRWWGNQASSDQPNLSSLYPTFEFVYATCEPITISPQPGSTEKRTNHTYIASAEPGSPQPGWGMRYSLAWDVNQSHLKHLLCSLKQCVHNVWCSVCTTRHMQHRKIVEDEKGLDAQHRKFWSHDAHWREENWGPRKVPVSNYN